MPQPSARAGWYGVLCWLTVSTLVGNEQRQQQRAAEDAGIFDQPAADTSSTPPASPSSEQRRSTRYRAITCKFNKKLKQGEMNETEEAVATGVGILGHLARAVVFCLIGLFLVKAAWEYDPKQARGLDGALLELAQRPYGGLLLGAVAAGLIAYGLYCFVQARYRRI